jgi:hypothetical protein
MSIEKHEFPTQELEISFLDSEQMWPVLDATVESAYDARDLSEKQLISWLTLPLASQVINEFITYPLIEKGIAEGLHVMNDGIYPHELDTEIAKAQKATKTGNASPPFVHLAIDPEQTSELKLFIPTAQNRYKHLIMDLHGKLSVRGSANLKEVSNPNRKVSILSKVNRKATKASLNETLKLPGNDGFGACAEVCNFPKTVRTPHSRAIRFGQVNGTKL